MLNSSQPIINLEQQLAFDLANYTNKNLFITGKAGTGKTTFLRELKNNTQKNTIVAAPTGVAAINAGGVTIHSLFLFPLTSFVPANDGWVDRNIAITKSELHQHFRYNKEKKKLLIEVELLILDEVSMLRADILDAINWALQSVRKNPAPFGGVQVIMIGDMYQLPPVIKDEQWNLLKKYYKSLFFFDAQVLQIEQPICIEFKKVYRQEDPVFISLLNAVRFQDYDSIDYELLHQRYDPDFMPEETGYITLTTHNYIADTINQQALEKLNKPIKFFEAIIDGVFPENSYPTEPELVLKEGSQVMFIRNDSSGEKRYFNGKIGLIEKIEDFDIYIRFENQKEPFKMEHEVWKNIKYNFDAETGKIKEEELGSFSQYPVRLAWAVTIHKSQGLTFDKVIIDAGKSFASGQVYVALSRCRTLEGIVLKSMIRNHNIIQDEKINEFQNQMWNVKELEAILEKEKYLFALQSLFRTLDIQSLLLGVYEWRKMTIEKSIPEKQLVLELISSIDECLHSLQIVARKFEGTLLNWYSQPTESSSQWEKIKNRSTNAVEYFADELFQKVWKPLILHYTEYKNKSRITLYLREIEELEGQIKLKIKQILSAELIDQRLTYKESIFISDSGKTVTSSSGKGDTVLLTLELINEGKSLEQVAKERNLTVSTISNHVAQLISKNKLPVLAFVSSDKYDVIKQKIEEMETLELKKLKDLLGEDYSYDEIKFVRSDLGK
ncbi:helix-turn-helix domain-containing protein [Apibacter sp. HY039]|uniref:helix-turn-helix domain-containing protein n=1 Tax=Apibacter sp. HY039 TaxID=2501476 RepID=UPI000FEBF7DF|nr:helix-turn-helix domain-containing protein [Apibacter sp. HY039]